jgi:hypothetical protein
MSYFPHGSFVAIRAAQEEQRRIEKEEEEMTQYTREDLEKDWEFKIVRSYSPVFRRPEVFQALLQEESVAGWDLVEKLDDRRVRFKRRLDQRRRDATLPLGFDPYRTQYGSGNTRIVYVLVGVVLAVALGVGVMVFAVVGEPGNSGDTWPLIATTIPAIIVLVGVAALIAARTRGV